MLLSALIDGPAVAFVLATVLFEFTDLSPGCSYDCIGRIVIYFIFMVALGAWELGVIIGSVHRCARYRVRRPSGA